jgi:hypothetical protein
VRIALLEKLSLLFKLDVGIANQPISDPSYLEELSIGSLIATEIWSCVIKNFRVNSFVLEILSGIPVKALMYAAVEDVPQNSFRMFSLHLRVNFHIPLRYLTQNSIVIRK